MNGYGLHAFSWINADGEICWVKYHFKTDQGTDPDYCMRDLHAAIDRGEYPSWTLEVQIMPFADAKTYRLNPFDVTKVWPHADYPLIDLGKMTLDRNVTGHHTEVEQATFAPHDLVPGTGLSPDKLLLGRSFAYADAHRYRVGSNHNQIPVNAPRVAVRSYAKDGQMRFVNTTDPVYAPNSYGGPKADPQRASEVRWAADGEMVRAAYTLRPDDDDWSQAGALVRDVMDETQREQLVHNIVHHVCDGVEELVLSRVFEYWRNIDSRIGEQVEQGVQANLGR